MVQTTEKKYNDFFLRTDIMKKIALDVDGVILNFGEQYLNVAQEVLQRPLSPDFSKYKLQDFLQVSATEDTIVWNYFNEKNHWKNIVPFPNVQEALKRIIDFNYEIFIVSAINPIHETARLINLKELGLVPTQIHCVGENNAPKHEIISQIHPHIFIDDRLDHLYRSSDVEHLGWVNQNQLQSVEYTGGVFEVSSLYEWTEKHLENISQLLEKKDTVKGMSKRIF